VTQAEGSLSRNASWKAGEKAADRGRGGHGHRLVGNGCVERRGEIVRGRRGAGASEIDVPVVDTAVIEKAPIGRKDGGLGSDLDLRPLHQGVVRVAENGKVIAIRLGVLAYLRGGF